MPRIAKELSAIAVKNINRPGLYAVGGVAGLHLQVSPSLAKSWILRVSVGGKRRDIGLGGFPSVPLAQAREKGRALREQVASGIDPIAQRKEARLQLEAQQAALVTFETCADRFMTAKSAEWKNKKHRQQWANTLKTYAYPLIGSLPVGEVTLAHITKILEPIWTEKTETASRLRGRIEAVLDWATVHGYRSGENPARWRGHLDKLFSTPSKIRSVKHHTAIPVTEIPELFQKIQQKRGLAAKALLFTILTASRSGETLGATWSEIDLQKGLWTIPAGRMKAKKEHRVPLSPTAVSLLTELPRMKDCDLLFPSSKGTPLSNMAMLTLLRKMEAKAVPHGFRSTFRDWCAEFTNYPRDIAEMALAHTIENKVEAAYRRGDMLKKRQALMKDWDGFLLAPPPKGSTVIPMRKQA